MASNENTIDWAKAAATWISQKHDGTQKKPVTENVRPQQPVVPFHTIVRNLKKKFLKVFQFIFYHI
jgi:hypothetical protein